MKLKPLIAALFFIFAAASGACWAGPKIDLPQGKEYILGNLEEGKIYERSFPIKNTGDSALEVRAVKVGCGCTTILYPKDKVMVPPAQAIEAKFTFNTEGMDGEGVKYIYIESNDPDEPVIKLKLTCNVQRHSQAVISRFLSFGLFTVMGAGLIDGFNPCAFTVLVFFISFLNFVGYRKRELLALGIIFILSVFVTYVLIGVGLFKFIRSLEVFGLLSKIIYLCTAALAIILGMYSLYDCYIYKKTGNPEEIKLKLPHLIKAKIQRIIQDATRSRTRTMIDLAIAVFISGFIVSLLESICTGQTYVPTIAYVLRTPSLRVSAFGYLALYNLMFILPLAVILIAALKGVSSEVFSKIAKGRLATIKLLTAGLFFLLGALLLLAKGGI